MMFEDDETTSLGNALLADAGAEELAYEEVQEDEPDRANHNNDGQYGWVEFDGKQCTNDYTSRSYGQQYCVGDTYTDPNGVSSTVTAISMTGLQTTPMDWTAEDTYSVGEQLGMTEEEWGEFTTQLQELNNTVRGLQGNMMGPTEQERGRLGIRISNENPDWTEEQVMAEADRLLEEKWMTSDAYAAAAAAETELFRQYGITKPNPAVYGIGTWVDEDGKSHRFESQNGAMYQTSQDDGFLDYAVPIGIAIGASIIGGQVGGIFTGGMQGAGAGAINSAVSSAITQGAMTGSIDPSSLLQAAILGGIGGFADQLQNAGIAEASTGVMGTADDIVKATADMLGMSFNDALDLLEGMATGAVTGADLEDIVLEAVGSYSQSQIKDYLTDSFGDYFEVEDWFKDGESHIPTEALYPFVEGAVNAAITGGMSTEEALKMAWGYFEAGGDIDFMLPEFKNLVSGWELDWPIDISKGDDWTMTQNEDGTWEVTWAPIDVPSLPPGWQMGDPCSDEEGNEGFLDGTGICEVTISPVGCGPGETWREALGQCVPDVLECMEGFEWNDLLNECVQVSIPPVGCGEGETWSEKLGECIPDIIECMEGFEWDGQTCVEIPDVLECMEGWEWSDLYQECVEIPDIVINPVGCGEGETWDELLGQCIPDIVECMEGFEWDGQQCVEIPDVIECMEGFEWDGQQCVEIPDIVECVQGFEWDGQQCVEIPDVVECMEGFDWDGQQCVQIEGPEITIPNPCEEGSFLDEAGICRPQAPNVAFSPYQTTWTGLFDYTDIDIYKAKTLAPMKNYIKTAKGMLS